VPALDKKTEDWVEVCLHQYVDRQEAIDALVKDCTKKGIIPSSTLALIVGGKIRYYPGLSSKGETTPKGYTPKDLKTVRIGPAGCTNVSDLFDTILHECRHVVVDQKPPRMSAVVQHVLIYTESILVDAKKTGIDKNPALMEDLWKSLSGYWSDIPKYLRSDPRIHKPYVDAYSAAKRTTSKVPSIKLDFDP